MYGAINIKFTASFMKENCDQWRFLFSSRCIEWQVKNLEDKLVAYFRDTCLIKFRYIIITSFHKVEFPYYISQEYLLRAFGPQNSKQPYVAYTKTLKAFWHFEKCVVAGGSCQNMLNEFILEDTFWDVTSSRRVNMYRRLSTTSCLHHYLPRLQRQQVPLKRRWMSTGLYDVNSITGLLISP